MVFFLCLYFVNNLWNAVKKLLKSLTVLRVKKGQLKCLDIEHFQNYRFKQRFHSTFLKTRVVCIMAADGGVYHQIIKCLMSIFYFWWIELKYNRVVKGGVFKQIKSAHCTAPTPVFKGKHATDAG